MKHASDIINVLAIIYISLPLLFLVVVGILYLIGKKIKNWDGIIDLAKWYLISVAAVFLGKMIELSIQDRETGMKEMVVYDKYVNIVLHTDSIEQQWALARYFACVTPTDRLRERWQIFYDTINKDYIIYNALKAKRELVEQSKLPAAEKADSLTKIDAKIQKINVSLQGTARPDNTAMEWEYKGFQALLNKDISGAIIAFNNSEQAINGFHMVYDIWFYLRKHKDEFLTGDDAKWIQFYGILLKDYQYGMPKEVKEQLKEKLRTGTRL
ncbi:hypothetical protein ACTJJ0_24535 [Chitinophaga sp. 22321]|uniref:DUF4760 domain-containing protein n=1 Tax=Chitinophaga hostae TaxID=2831022 RepID=A0ABS5J643_9BACT|nr:hypothetical protein [Chitinophaga hostae]MBS0030694.1 hypothetical protein [Chitinophaga hostae]